MLDEKFKCDVEEVNSSLKFIDDNNFVNNYDENYLKKLRCKAKNWISKINVDDYINKVRGRVE